MSDIMGSSFDLKAAIAINVSLRHHELIYKINKNNKNERRKHNQGVLTKTKFFQYGRYVAVRNHLRGRVADCSFTERIWSCVSSVHSRHHPSTFHTTTCLSLPTATSGRRACQERPRHDGRHVEKTVCGERQRDSQYSVWWTRDNRKR